MNHIERIKEWKLYRVVYDQMGLRATEGERPAEEFEKLCNNCDIGWLIGYKPSLDYATICTVLEGNKEVLEFVLDSLKFSVDSHSWIT